MHKIGSVGYAVLLTGLLVVLPGFTCVPTPVVPGIDDNQPSDTSTFADEVIDLVNVERRANGLQELARNQILADVAQAYAKRMADIGFFAHEDALTGSMPWDRAAAAGYTYVYFGENIAAGQRTPQEVMTGWMNSPGHRENILRPQFTEIGVGMYSGGSLRTYWVQEFGQPQ
jgi:uncharacterized protein YkwD